MDYKTMKINGYKGSGDVEVIVDEDVYELVSKWSWKLSGPNGYARRTIRKGNGWTTLYLHRFIMGLESDSPYVIDHVNGNKLDCRKSNMRIVTQIENVQNSRIASHNTSGTKGVWWDKRLNRWRSEIWVNGRKKYLGIYISAEQAAEARREAESKYMLYLVEIRASHAAYTSAIGTYHEQAKTRVRGNRYRQWQ